MNVYCQNGSSGCRRVTSRVLLLRAIRRCLEIRAIVGLGRVGGLRGARRRAVGGGEGQLRGPGRDARAADLSAVEVGLAVNIESILINIESISFRLGMLFHVVFKFLK